MVIPDLCYVHIKFSLLIEVFYFSIIYCFVTILVVILLESNVLEINVQVLTYQLVFLMYVSTVVNDPSVNMFAD